MMAAQTPVTYQTPAAIYYNMPKGSTSTAGKTLEVLFEGIKENCFVPPADGPHPLAQVWGKIDALYGLGENWNGYDVSAPNPDAIETAKTWIADLYANVINEGFSWHNPHVSANESGSVVFEWVQNTRRFVVYVSPTEVFYIKAWGLSIASEMSDGDAADPADSLPCWTWLFGNRGADA